MEKLSLFILMALSGLVLAQQAGVQSAMATLCETSKSMLGVGIMVLVFLSFLLLLAGAALFILKKEDKTFKLVGMILLAIGVLFLVGACIGLVLYVFAPNMIAALTGAPNAADACNPQPPYCPPGNATCMTY